VADEQRGRSGWRGEARPDAGDGAFPLALDPASEGFLDGLARLARRDPAARNALYRRFEPFCERVAARLAAQRWVRLAELDDVRHEGFLVFCELVADWPERGSFAGYVFAHFAPRLARAVRRFEGMRPRQRGPRRPSSPDGGGSERPEAVEGALAACELLAGLDPADRALVELLVAGYRPSEAAARLGVTPRTVRRWLRNLRATVASLG